MKKITFIDVIVFLGFILIVVGLGIKFRGAEEVTKGSKNIEVVKSKEPLTVLVNINKASVVELDVLPAIGPVTAQKIVDYRNKWGGFKSKEEIKKVSGIGEKTYEKFKDIIEI